MEYLLILNTFRIPRSSLDIQDGIYEKKGNHSAPVEGLGASQVCRVEPLPGQDRNPAYEKIFIRLQWRG